MKRIRPAPMGRAYRYVRRISHIELVLAERGKNGEAVATVVGEETKAPAKTKRRSRAPQKRKAAAK
jgi:large subunit ribosomal protein L22